MKGRWRDDEAADFVARYGERWGEELALRMAYNAVGQGAAGVDMGRNIFQSECPEAMIQAVRKVVHEDARAEEAHEVYLGLKEGIEKDAA